MSLRYLYWVLTLALVYVSCAVTSATSIESRSLTADLVEYGVDLNATNFDAVLKYTPATFAVVEFYAHWCPACRNYKPHYEKVARLFNGPDAAHPGIIIMTRVDCALKINTKLCDKFSVSHYPMLFWGPPSKFVGGGWEPNQKNSDIRPIHDGRTADRLLNWINKQMSSSYGLDDQKFENEHLLYNVSDPTQIARAIYDVEEATSIAFDSILGYKMIKPQTRGSLIKFLQLLVARHPSWRCRKGASDILVSFGDLNTIDLQSANKQEDDDGKLSLRNFQICGKDVPRRYWMFCRGSKYDTRGFSCGLWVLLHSLSVRIEDGESQFTFNAICDYIHNFFICEECRQHFYHICTSVSTPFNKARDFALWLWSAHNKFNERLMEEEAMLGTGDPKFPKMIWPPSQLCPSCYLSRDQKSNKVECNQDEVFKFLRSYYGDTLATLYKDKGTNGNNVIDGVAEAPLVTKI
ncbi:hypothetical protein L6164_026783 [Bauhinia variegata]|uniref:Uncharacterized protein n=1 Tax=Bauhinia variegata TaxID=167791 RepID=A0ACB9LSS0_BAUVA|nr:hypothetical protein L6164_026783 [Bauhinia variegata]